MTAHTVISRVKTRYSAAIATRRRRWLILALLAGLVGGGVLFWRAHREAPPEEPAAALPQVTVRTLAELAREATIDKIGVIEPAVHAPLIARTGGIVTAIPIQLGEQAAAGAAVVHIDGQQLPNPVRVQLASVQAAEAAFADIERAAIRSAELVVETARLSRETAVTGRQLSREQADAARAQADLQVHQAELSLRDAAESEQRIDALVRAADLALQAAGLAQDQATLARRSAYQQSNDALEQATTGVAAAEQAVARLRADLASQRVALSGQVAAAHAQIQLQQVVAPVNGEVARLSVRVGDFVQPGAVIGEVTAAAGARTSLAVSHGVRAALAVGQTVNISTDQQQFTGSIAQLADTPSAETALWQVDIFITETPEVIHPGDLVVVHLPAALPAGTATFVPLDAVVIRQAGAVVFTIDEAGVAHEHAVRVADYAGDFVEITADLPAAARVVVGGNRQLRDGLAVAVQS